MRKIFGVFEVFVCVLKRLTAGTLHSKLGPHQSKVLCVTRDMHGKDTPLPSRPFLSSRTSACVNNSERCAHIHPTYLPRVFEREAWIFQILALTALGAIPWFFFVFRKDQGKEVQGLDVQLWERVEQSTAMYATSTASLAALSASSIDVLKPTASSNAIKQASTDRMLVRELQTLAWLPLQRLGVNKKLFFVQI